MPSASLATLACEELPNNRDCSSVWSLSSFSQKFSGSTVSLSPSISTPNKASSHSDDNNDDNDKKSLWFQFRFNINFWWHFQTLTYLQLRHSQTEWLFAMCNFTLYFLHIVNCCIVRKALNLSQIQNKLRFEKVTFHHSWDRIPITYQDNFVQGFADL